MIVFGLYVSTWLLIAIIVLLFYILGTIIGLVGDSSSMRDLWIDTIVVTLSHIIILILPVYWLLRYIVRVIRKIKAVVTNGRT